MTLSRQNAVLSQAINVSDNAIGDTIFIPSGNVVNLSGILTATSGNFINSLQLNGTGVSVSGHAHTSSDIINFNSSVSGLLPVTNIINGTNIVVSSTSGTYTISTSGVQNQFVNTNNTITGNTTISASRALIYNALIFSSPVIANISLPSSGHLIGDIIVVASTNSFVSGSILSIINPLGQTLDVITRANQSYRYISQSNGAPNAWVKVSVDSHTHISDDITNFNSSVSGLLPTISNSGDNRVLTSTGSSVGINAESNLTFNGSLLSISGSGSFSNNVTASGFVRSGGTNSQFLKADGSVDSTSYQSLLTNPVTGTGVANHIPYWSSTSGLLADSNQLIWDASNNRLGIGTTTPSGQLHVIGSGIFSSGLNVNGLLISNSGNFTNSLQVNGTGVSLNGHTHDQSSIINSVGDIDYSNFTWLSFENISDVLSKIDTNFSPIVHSHSTSDITDFASSVSGLLPVKNIVAGTNITVSSNSGVFTINSTSNISGTGISNHIAYWNSSSEIVADSGQLYWDSVNNRLGIGTSTPSVRLHVEGDGKFNGNLTVNSGVIIGDEINYLTGDALIINFGDGGGRLASFINGSVQSNSSINLNADTTFNRVDGAGSLPFIISPTGYAGSGAVTQGFWRGSTIEVNKGGTGRTTYSNGQLLIGSGTSLVANTLTAGTGISITNGSGTITINSSLNNPVTGTGVANHIAYWNSSSGIVADSGQLFWDATNNRLGIGTDSPSQPLDVSGNIRSYDGSSDLVLGYNAIFDGYGLHNFSSNSLFLTSDNNNISLWSPFGIVLDGDANNIILQANVGNVGIGTATPEYKLQVSGSFGATTKSFRIDHPSKKGYSLEYGSLESPYHGVRLTGRGKVIKGVGTVDLPDYLKDLIHDDESIVVQLTNYKHRKTLYVDMIDLQNDRFFVKSDRAKTLGELEFFWTLTGTRKDVEDLVVEKEN